MGWKVEKASKGWEWTFWAGYWYETGGFTRTKLGASWKARRIAKQYWGR